LDADAGGSVMAVEWFFALVEPEETTFSPAYAVQDYQVLSFSLSQDEGNFAKLEIDIKNPRLPLLGGLIWLWFSYSIDAAPAVPLFFGRLVGIPQSIFAERVTLEFIARPRDFGSQKEAIAQALKVLPHYDAVFVDEQRREDLDIVLEGYSYAWHIDRVTHEVTTSDVLIAEDGVIPLAENQLLYRGFSIDFNQVPLTSVDMEGVFNWDQIAGGEGIDITSAIVGNWPNEGYGAGGNITSFTLQEGDWPQPKASLGNGWVAADTTSCLPVYDLAVLTRSRSFDLTIDWGGWADVTGATGSTKTNFTESTQYLKTIPPGSIELPNIVTAQTFEQKFTEADPDVNIPQKLASFTIQTAWARSVIPLHHLKATLVVAFDANRPRAETLRFRMIADIQPILTLPGDDEVEVVKLNSVRLNNPLDPDEATDSTDTVLLPPMRDARRRSYVVTERGRSSVEYLLAVARAKLLKRSRAVQVTHILTTDAALQLIPDITLRKNVTVSDPRLPDGEALGKLVAYKFTLDGTAGTLECSVTIGCAPGRGGEVTEVLGSPVYAEWDVMGPDVQESTGGSVVFDNDMNDVAYSDPLFLPNDDGVDFLSTLTADDLIEEALTVQNPPALQRAALINGVAGPGMEQGIQPYMVGKLPGQEAVDARNRTVLRILEEVPTAARFKLKNMTGSFQQEQDIDVTVLKVPAMINLEFGTA
jgi:hypothetical protein